MNHISLNVHDEAVREFFLGLPADFQGSVVELNGRALACVVPVGPPVDNDDDWTDAKNTRRCELIDKEIDSSLEPAEAVELTRLQAEMLRYRRKVAPLPLDDARRLHQELLKKAAQQQAG